MNPKSSTTPEQVEEPLEAVENATPKLLDLEQAAELVKLTPFRVRTAIRQGLLKAHKEPVEEGSKVVKHMIAYEDLMAWRSITGTHTKREDGRNKFTIWLTPTEYEEFQKLQKANHFEVPIKRANTKKAAQA